MYTFVHDKTRSYPLVKLVLLHTAASDPHLQHSERWAYGCGQ